MDLGSANYQILYTVCNGKPRTCIVAKSNLKIFFCTQYSSPDLTVVRVELPDGKNINIASVYLHGDKDAPSAEMV